MVRLLALAAALVPMVATAQDAKKKEKLVVDPVKVDDAIRKGVASSRSGRGSS